MLLDHDTLVHCQVESGRAAKACSPRSTAQDPLDGVGQHGSRDGRDTAPVARFQPCRGVARGRVYTVWGPIAKLNWHGLCVRGPLLPECSGRQTSPGPLASASLATSLVR